MAFEHAIVSLSRRFIHALFPPPAPVPQVRRVTAKFRGHGNSVFGGAGRITGTVKNKGTPNAPVFRRVRLFRDRDAHFVAETWSDPITGAYAFNDIDERHTYTVIAYDHTENFRAEIADRITPELMP